MNLKQSWIIPLIIIIGLTGAWHFRWERITTQQIKQLKIIHLRDRWLNQEWVQVYGIEAGQIISGDTEPYFSQKEINTKANELIKGPRGISKDKDLKQKIARENEIIAKYQASADEYNKQFKILENDYKKQNPYKQLLKTTWLTLGEYSWKASDYACSKISSLLSQEIISEGTKYNEAVQNREQLEYELENLKATWGKPEAKKELIRSAYSNRKVMTICWIVLISLSSLWLIVALVYINKSRTKQNVSNQPTSSELLD